MQAITELGFFDVTDKTMRDAALSTMTHFCMLALTSLPWRDMGVISAKIAPAMYHCLAHVRCGVRHQLMDCNVDCILPPMNGILSVYDAELVVEEITRVSKRKPMTTLQVYEGLFDLVCDDALIRRDASFTYLFYTLFSL